MHIHTKIIIIHNRLLCRIWLKEKQIAIRAWDRDLKNILENQKRTKPKKVFPKKNKKTESKRALPKETIEEEGDTITYEQFLKEENLRDFTKKQ